MRQTEKQNLVLPWLSTMFVLARTATYATLFIGLVLVLVPSWLLAWSGIARPEEFGVSQLVGIVVGAAGGTLALWCIVTFSLVGKGTPAPFDPPRRLVVQGPYRYVRNPMYIGAALALTGAGVFYLSVPLLAYVCLFLVATHVFVVVYEEPALTRLFGEDYQAYCTKVRRWLPRL